MNKGITEDYVSFEVAKLLKEKGFNGECRMIYREHDMQMIYHTPNPNNLLDFTTNRGKLEKHSKKQHCDYALCPTHQMALKWLRKVYKLFIEIVWTGYENMYSFNVTNMKDGFIKEANIACSYNEAVEAALKYTLENLI